mmetsp:Transcript_38372/g.109654  ORF Transcript_38372/g.109654 Transcript_38372/m.109654 type:complete len:90 (+) Transcript_38372:1499-1768(+)
MEGKRRMRNGSTPKTAMPHLNPSLDFTKHSERQSGPHDGGERVIGGEHLAPRVQSALEAPAQQQRQRVGPHAGDSKIRIRGMNVRAERQ